MTEETEETAQVRDDALNVLHDMLNWSMPPARWEETEEILSQLAGDPDLTDLAELARFSNAVIMLELAAPARITKIDKAAVPVPDKIRERVNHLVHELARPTPPVPREESEAGE